MINIVTIFHFGETNDLMRTINSLNQQNNTDFHVWFVLANASSTDILFISKHCDFSYSLTVNSDSGLYNAMNIAIDQIQTGLVYFLNGGDELYNANSLSIIAHKSDRSRCNWFSTIQTFENDVYLRKASLSKDGSYFPAHQGFVVERRLISDERFKESLRIASDHFFMSELHNRVGTVMHSDIVANMLLGGISNRPSWKTVQIRFSTQGRYRAFKELIKLFLRLTVSDKRYYRVILRKWRLSND